MYNIDRSRSLRNVLVVRRGTYDFAVGRRSGAYATRGRSYERPRVCTERLMTVLVCPEVGRKSPARNLVSRYAVLRHDGKAKGPRCPL